MHAALKHRFKVRRPAAPLPLPPARPDLQRSIDSVRQVARTVPSPEFSQVLSEDRELRMNEREVALETREAKLQEREEALTRWEQDLMMRERAVLESTRELSEEAMLLAARERQVAQQEAELAERLTESEIPVTPTAEKLLMELSEREEAITALENRVAITEALLRQQDRRIAELSAKQETASPRAE